jgi:hypothetical protein
MVASYLLERFDIMAGEATIRRHDQEDFFLKQTGRELPHLNFIRTKQNSS